MTGLTITITFGVDCSNCGEPLNGNIWEIIWRVGETKNLAYTHDYCVDDFERQRDRKRAKNDRDQDI